jgi:hypothetical protein
MELQIMTTEEYASKVYHKYAKTGTASQQRIRKMIKDGTPLPQVEKMERIGNNKYYILLYVRV